MSSIARIIDANFNRTREALRVLEDVARFGLNDADLTGQLKNIRHEVSSAVQEAAESANWFIEAHRDTAGDVGTSMIGLSEMERHGLIDVVSAAAKRLTESLRVLEETCKIVNADSAARIEKSRYHAYTIESRMLLSCGTGRARQWKLCVLLTESVCLRPWKDVVCAVVDAGADCVQVREKEMSDRALQQRVEEIIDIARPRGVSVIVNDRADIAMAAGADGVHLGEHDMTVHYVRQIAGRSLLVGVSTHSMDEARSAINAGADYCGVGMMFTSALKPDRSPEGIEYMRSFLKEFPNAPHVAIGGITSENVSQLVESGACGVAVCSAICGSHDPALATRQFLDALTLTRESASA